MNKLRGGNTDLAPQVSTLLCRRKLILETHCGRSSFDQRLHYFESIQGAPEARLAIRLDGSKPMNVLSTFEMRNLVGPPQRVIDSSHESRATGHRIQTF